MLHAIAVTLVALPLLAGVGIKPVHVSKTELINFAPGGTIHVEGSYGDLTVEGWDRPEVELTVVKSAWTAAEARNLERVQVSAKRTSETELTISTVAPSRNPLLALVPRRSVAALSYEIHVPHNSKLVIHHGAGDVFVIDIAGDIEVASSRGDIVLMLAENGKYSIDAKSAFGVVSSDFEGDPHHNHLVGERVSAETPSWSRRIVARTGFGGVTIKSIPPENREKTK